MAPTYSLEHEGESVLFDQLFGLLNSSMQNEESYRRELASCTGALQTSISQHMSKEEEQVIICMLQSVDYNLICYLIYLKHLEIDKHKCHDRVDICTAG